jgi:GNAT superfamily N-acetyltransferase
MYEEDCYAIDPDWQGFGLGGMLQQWLIRHYQKLKEPKADKD